jgi:hypothetical protein
MTDQELIADLMRAVGTDDPNVLLARVHYDRLAVKDSEAVYGVYVQVNANNYVTAVDSDAFIPDLSWWIKVDSGTGELYKYARVNYCPKGLQTDGGFNYKLVNGVVVYAPQVEQPEDHNEMASQEEFFIASRRYTPGELISIQGRMYEVISIILPESKIIPGSNVREITLEQYINKKVEEATA